MESHIELESLQKKWLGKNYADHDLDPELERKCQLALQIPAAMRAALLPNPELDVLSFLHRTWPRAPKSAGLFGRKAEMCYLTTLPLQDDLVTAGRQLPSRDFAAKARAHLGQALLNGSSSIIDPIEGGGRLPIWVVQYWQEAHNIMPEIAAAREVWENALAWLREHDDGSTTMKECHGALAQLPWSEIAIAQGFATSTKTTAFARILSDQQLTTTLVDVFVNIIADIVRSDPALDEAFEILDLVFMVEIEKAKTADRWNHESGRYLRKLEERMTASQKTLLFPMHLPERIHFISAVIDFKAQTIAYGTWSTVRVYQTCLLMFLPR